MAGLRNITSLFKTNLKTDMSGLAVSFKELTEIRRYVPYLKGFDFKTSSNKVGDFKSSFKGRGMEFEEVRAYTFGDDVRDIDWRVTARKNQPFTKLYAEEKDREVYVWLDLSASMRFGTKKELKSVTACKIAALLGWFALTNRDRFGLIAFDGNKTHIFEPKRNYEHLLILLKKIEQISKETLYQKNESQKNFKSLQLAHKKIGRKAIVFMISSFLNFEDNLKFEISSFSQNNDVCLVNVFDILEEMAPPKGEYLAQYKDIEQLLVSSGKKYDQDYQKYFLSKRQNVKDFCAKFNCKYRQVRSDLPIYKQLRPL